MKGNKLKIALLLIISLSLLISCKEALPHLEQIKERGELRVVTRYAPTSYYVKGEQLAGLEYELVQRFARHLNVKLTIIVPDNLNKMMELLTLGQADLAAAGLTVTDKRKESFIFGPVYQEVTQQLVYKRGNIKPKNVTDLLDSHLEVVANSSHVAKLKSYQEEIPQLRWTENSTIDSSGLLELVELELIDYTVADSNEFITSQRLFPELRVAFDLSEPQPLAWAMPIKGDLSLAREVSKFFHAMEESGELDQLIEKYYGHIRRFDYVDTRAIHRRLLTHLPKYSELFKHAGREFNFDWLLLAAVSYQESHWDPQAVSSTGVKGLMMLTKATAKDLGVTDREAPSQSIYAGTKYLNQLRNRLPDRIKEPDKTWFSLAAYNIGLGHLEDARILAQKDGANPDLWMDVSKYLPLLTKKKWYSQTKYGYARGGEPVRYIENIRRYYDILQLQNTGINNNIKTDKSTVEARSLPSAL
jgi:membrane-bound lytic murein transglycosylase F